MTKIFNQTLRDGGGTFDAASLTPIGPGNFTVAARPYVVGGANGVPEKTFDLDSPGTAKAVEAYVGHLARVERVTEVGTWIDHDNHVIVVDAVERYRSRDYALTVARTRDEKAIFDLVHGEEITIS